MAKCARAESGSFLRLWPIFSAASLRRKLLEALACGSSSRSRRHSSASPPPQPRPRSDRLVELLRAADASESGSDEADPESRRKVEAFEELRRVATELQIGDNAGGYRRREAVVEVRRLAKDDPAARVTLAMLGAIPPLVGMLGSDDAELQISALYALLNLGISDDANKAAIVKAGAVHKMLGLVEQGSHDSIAEAVVANFLSLSALDSNKPVIGSSGAIPFLVGAFQNPSPGSRQAKQDALRALFNLSIAAPNAPHLVDAGLVPALLASIGDMEASERALAALSNLVAAPEGRRAVSRAGDVFRVLVDVLYWADAPGCQENAAYILLVMAHKLGFSDREAMVEAGVVSALLELALVGSALAQKRASRILEMLGGDKGKQVCSGKNGGEGSGVAAMSAPLVREEEGGGKGGEEREGMISEEKRAVRQLVQQSLQSNMRRIVRRARLPQDFAPSEHLKALTASSTSKSLPF